MLCSTSFAGHTDRVKVLRGFSVTEHSHCTQQGREDSGKGRGPSFLRPTPPPWLWALRAHLCTGRLRPLGRLPGCLGSLPTSILAIGLPKSRSIITVLCHTLAPLSGAARFTQAETAQTSVSCTPVCRPALTCALEGEPVTHCNSIRAGAGVHKAAWAVESTERQLSGLSPAAVPPASLSSARRKVRTLVTRNKRGAGGTTELRGQDHLHPHCRPARPPPS